MNIGFRFIISAVTIIIAEKLQWLIFFRTPDIATDPTLDHLINLSILAAILSIAVLIWGAAAITLLKSGCFSWFGLAILFFIGPITLWSVGQVLPGWLLVAGFWPSFFIGLPLAVVEIAIRPALAENPQA